MNTARYSTAITTVAHRILIVFVSALLLACGGGGGDASDPSTPPPVTGPIDGGGGDGGGGGGGTGTAPSSLQFPTVTLYQHSIAHTPTPTFAGDAPSAYSINPALPAGLALGSDGRISGAPLVTLTTSNFVVTASNAAGQTTASLSLSVLPPGQRILMFVAYNDVWWAEYKVMYEALWAAGYQVQVCSSEAAGYATSYQTDGDIADSANSLVGGGSDYNDFIVRFNEQFGLGAWNEAWTQPADIPITCAIQDIPSMAPYVALVIPGGVGAKSYYRDGSYAISTNGAGHSSSAANVQAAAEKLNALTIEALQSSKPVLAQCHGAPLLAWMRAPGTQGQGPDLLGLSLLQGRTATGFHLPPPIGEAGTADMYTTLSVIPQLSRTVVIDGPAPAQLGGSKAGTSKLITTRDWYPQTVAHGAATLINVLKSHPRQGELAAPRKVLILHGGAVDQSNVPASCLPAAFATNDVPCNWGLNMPADFTHLQALLGAASSQDPFTITVTQINLRAALPAGFNVNSATDVKNYLINQGVDVVVYFKHWSNGEANVTNALQQGLLNFADDGRGLVALHHGLYNNGGIDTLADAFGAQANSTGWVGSTNPYTATPPKFLNINYGHFVTSFGTLFNASLELDPGYEATLPNFSASGYPSIAFQDELYLNMGFDDSQEFGVGVGKVNLLLGNDLLSHPNQMLTAGFSKLYNPSANASIGRLVYLQPGENPANYAVGSSFGQMVRNAVIWAAMGQR